MRNIFTAIVRFFVGPGSGILLFAMVGLAYYLAKN
jgi:hypothetical protein